MTALSFALVLAGVLLNAAAQLLLKAGTNAVGQFEFAAANALPVGLKLALRTAHPRRHRVLRSQRRRLDPGAVARRGEHRLPDALDRLRRERDRRVLPLRRGGDGHAARGHRRHHPRRVHRGAQLAMEKEVARVGLRITVATARGAARAVPRLVEILVRHGVTATFYFNLGPDRLHRFLPAREVGARASSAMQAVRGRRQRARRCTAGTLCAGRTT